MSKITCTIPACERLVLARGFCVNHHGHIERDAPAVAPVLLADNSAPTPEERVRYARYMKSDAWREKREQAFDKYGRACQKCGAQDFLHVHHLTYERLERERLTDLRVLCNPCHTRVHQVADMTGDIRQATMWFLKR